MESHSSQVRRFVERLASAEPAGEFRNPYRSPYAVHNLLQFLGLQRPSTNGLVLVGEAPGYRGAAVSGVPFSSLAVLTEDWGDPWGAFGPGRYITPPTQKRIHFREATATMVWRVLAEQLAENALPITWNAVPFHPVGPKDASNRPIRNREISLGRVWLEGLLELFPSATPLAVGRVASRALTAAGIQHDQVRHPSYGGLSDFRHGIRMQCNQLGLVEKAPTMIAPLGLSQSQSFDLPPVPQSHHGG